MLAALIRQTNRHRINKTDNADTDDNDDESFAPTRPTCTCRLLQDTQRGLEGAELSPSGYASISGANKLP